MQTKDIELLNKQIYPGSILIGGGAIPTAVDENCTFQNQDIRGISDYPKEQQDAVVANYAKLSSCVAKKWQVKITLTEGKFKGRSYTIAPLSGIDAVRNETHIYGLPLFPQNINLGMSHDLTLAHQVGLWTRDYTELSGFNWIFSPTMAVISDQQNETKSRYAWGRTYEAFSTDPVLVSAMSAKIISGIQQDNRTMATMKHYFADGSSEHGVNPGVSSPYLDKLYPCSSKSKELCHSSLLPYTYNAEQSYSVMVTYGAVKFNATDPKVPVLADPVALAMFNSEYPLTESNAFYPDYKMLQNFARQGFLITDMGAIQANAWYTPIPNGVKTALEYGVSMFMLENWSDDEHYSAILQDITAAKLSPQILEQRLYSLLMAKNKFGLVHNSEQKIQIMPSASNFSTQDLLRGTEETLVLLKNAKSKVNHQAVLPLSMANKTKNIILVGSNTVGKGDKFYAYNTYNSIGHQVGGWGMQWQGVAGNVPFNATAANAGRVAYTLPDGKLAGDNLVNLQASSILDGLIDNLPKDRDVNLYLVNPHADSGDLTTLMNNSELAAKMLNRSIPSNVHLIAVTDLAKLQQLSKQDSVIINTLAEPPYAEGAGDINERSGQLDTSFLFEQPLLESIDYVSKTRKTGMNHQEQNTVTQLHNAGYSVISILLSGRPKQIDNEYKSSDAFIAAFLPGTSGGNAIAELIYGKYTPTLKQAGHEYYQDMAPNTLSMAWYFKDAVLPLGYGCSLTQCGVVK